MLITVVIFSLLHVIIKLCLMSYNPIWFKSYHLVTELFSINYMWLLAKRNEPFSLIRLFMVIIAWPIYLAVWSSKLFSNNNEDDEEKIIEDINIEFLTAKISYDTYKEKISEIFNK